MGVLLTSAKENCFRSKNEPFQTFPNSWELGKSAACSPPASPQLLLGCSGFRGVTAEGVPAQPILMFLKMGQNSKCSRNLQHCGGKKLQSALEPHVHFLCATRWLLPLQPRLSWAEGALLPFGSQWVVVYRGF